MDLTEGRGTGIPKIIRAMAENGSPPPEFHTDEDHSFFATRLPIHPDAKVASGHLHGDLHGGKGAVAEEALRLVAALDGEWSRQAMQEALGLGNREHFRKAYLLPALAAGLVEMTLPDTPKSRSQRYRLTQAGWRWRNQTGQPGPG